MLACLFLMGGPKIGPTGFVIVEISDGFPGRRPHNGPSSGRSSSCRFLASFILSAGESSSHMIWLARLPVWSVRVFDPVAFDNAVYPDAVPVTADKPGFRPEPLLPPCIRNTPNRLGYECISWLFLSLTAFCAKPSETRLIFTINRFENWQTVKKKKKSYGWFGKIPCRSSRTPDLTDPHSRSASVS